MHRHLNRFKNRKSLIALVAILGIVLITVGATYAWFSYSRNGVKENTITAGSIKFHYAEGNRTIEVDDMMPMTNAQGKAQTDYFDFNITSKTSDTLDIPYYITVKMTDDSDEVMAQVVKVYLTKVDNNGNETEVLLSNVSELGTYTHNSITIPVTEKLLYTDRVYAGDRNYNQTYRLRIWISDEAKFIVQTEVAAHCVDTNNQTVTQINNEPASIENCKDGYTWVPANVENSYPYEGKTYSLKINVYSNGEEINQTQQEIRENVNIEDVVIENNVVTSDTTTLEEEETMPVGSTTMQKTITVNTVNPDTTVTIENLTPTASLVDTNIKKISSNHEVTLKLGTNTFRITTTSVTRRTSKQYTLIIDVAYPSYNVNISGNHLTLSSNNIDIQYGSNNILTVEPSTGYYLSEVNCSTGYTHNAIIGTSATSSQTITITNINYEDEGSCTFSVAPIVYTITYNLNDGENPNDAKESYTIEDTTFDLPVPTKQSSDFEGWYMDVEFTGDPVKEITQRSTGNKVFYAKWEEVPIYYVKFDGNNSTSGDMNVQEIQRDLPTLLTENVYERDGYIFAGWSTSSTATAPTYADNAEVTNLANASSTITLYAVWIKKVYNINTTNTVVTYTVYAPGQYKLEVWGAQGANSQNSTYVGGKGGYASGKINLTAGDKLYIVLGTRGTLSASGSGKAATGGYNGGGACTSYYSSERCVGGGGATHIALNSNRGFLKNYVNNTSEILVVAAGGGGGYYNNSDNHGKGGYGGGSSGGTPTSKGAHATKSGRDSTAGTQSGPGQASSGYAKGGFGYGGSPQTCSACSTNGKGTSGAGGGAGWYGGGGAFYNGGSGGSSYVKSTMSDRINAAGNSSMPNTAGTGNETGHAGNGYAKITYLGE